MKFSLTLAVVAIAGVSAEPGVVGSYVIPAGGDLNCQAHNIVQTCLSIEGPKKDSCMPSDWACLCDAAQAEMTCFNNCPNDDRRFGAKAVVDSWCAAASSYPKSSSTVKVVSSTASSSITIQTGPPSSSTTSSQASQKTNGAESLVGNAAGMMAAVAGVVAAVL